MATFRQIIKKKNFWPLFSCQGLGAFNDNFFRAALSGYIAYQVLGYSESGKALLTSLAMGLMVLPFFLFSSLAGQLADRYKKSTLVKITKISELAVMSLAALCFFLESVPLLFVSLFLMGSQSAFFGPLKYGLLPEVLPEDELLAGNGLFEALTFVAIVFGTLLGTFLGTLANGNIYFVSPAMVLVALFGLWTALKQPVSEPGDETIKISPKIWQSTFEIIASVKERSTMWLSILAISWFWLVGSIMMSQIPNLVHDVMGASRGVTVFLMTFFVLGIGLGSIVIQWVLKGAISARLVPAVSALMAIFMIDLSLAIWALPPKGATLLTLSGFWQSFAHLRIAFDCFCISFVGGIYVVPLNAIIQHQALPTERARVIAANNIVNAAFMCLGSLLVMLIISLGFSLSMVFSFLAFGAVLVTVMTLYLLPQESMKSFGHLILKIFFRPKISGLENFKSVETGPALLLANHTSFLDVALLAIYCPRKLTFAINTEWAKVWWIKPLLSIFNAVPLDPQNPLATRTLIDCLEKGEMVAIFPEGRISDTGTLMKVYDGPALVALKSRAPILPVIIDGPQYSRLFGRFWKTLGWTPKVRTSMAVLPRRHLLENAAQESHKEERQKASLALYDLMVESIFASRNYNKSLWTALEENIKQEGKNRPIIEDISRQLISYGRFHKMAKILGRKLAQLTNPGEKVGFLLPNSVPSVATLFGLWAGGRVPVMLNYTQGRAPLTSAVETALLKSLITSKAFVQKLGLEEMMASLPIRLIYLEDIAPSFWDKICGLFWRPQPAGGESPSVVLFTSGSEGKPKGVALSHKNMLSNIYQVKDKVGVNQKDVLFNALPMFHTLGLTICTVLPLVLGLRSFVFISPLQPKAIAELIYDTRTTITAASDTFAAAWAKVANPYDFSHMRIMLVGAEKLKETTRRLYFEKLGVRLFEGYGVTETSPVLAVNTAMHFKAGTVGRLLPGLKAHLAEVEGVSDGGSLMVSGPNVMMGYILPENPGVIAPLTDGWHNTQDIVEIDKEGYITIKGRQKRFAKIAGEMVSLAAVEEVAANLWPGRIQVVVSRPDEKKGEKLVLITEEEWVDLPNLWAALKENGFPEIFYPREFKQIKGIPLTPMGKIDMPKLLKSL